MSRNGKQKKIPGLPPDDWDCLASPPKIATRPTCPARTRRVSLSPSLVPFPPSLPFLPPFHTLGQLHLLFSSSAHFKSNFLHELCPITTSMTAVAQSELLSQMLDYPKAMFRHFWSTPVVGTVQQWSTKSMELVQVRESVNWRVGAVSVCVSVSVRTRRLRLRTRRRLCFAFALRTFAASLPSCPLLRLLRNTTRWSTRPQACCRLMDTLGTNFIDYSIARHATTFPNVRTFEPSRAPFNLYNLYNCVSQDHQQDRRTSVDVLSSSISRRGRYGDTGGCQEIALLEAFDTYNLYVQGHCQQTCSNLTTGCCLAPFFNSVVHIYLSALQQHT